MITILRYLVLASFFIFIGCKSEEKKAITTNPIEFTKEGELSIFKQETDSLITSLDIEIADSDYEIQTGLMYRKGMKTNRGMLFIFEDVRPHSFYMKNTQFPLDIIFIDEKLKIASFQKNAQPLDESSLPSNAPVQYVLEVNAGLSDQWGLVVGDRISFSRQ